MLHLHRLPFMKKEIRFYRNLSKDFIQTLNVSRGKLIPTLSLKGKFGIRFKVEIHFLFLVGIQRSKELHLQEL